MRECPRCERCYDDETLVCPEDSANTKATLPGTTMLAGRYLLEKRLGRGAMGQVYLARDQNLLTRRVAVKTVRPDILTDGSLQQGEAIARFEREARTAASIRHPNVVDVTDFGKSPEGIFYLVMEYVEGETLHHLLRREGTLSVPRALDLLRQVAAGVDAAHDEGILHRDLKPANIFIMQKRKKDGSMKGDGFVKVGDFGLAKIVNQAIAEYDSANGPASRGIIGTPEYMAPEQMQPGADLDARADVYALGTIAYHMLGGRPPYTGDLAQLIMQKILNPPQALNTLRSDIPPEIERAVMHALEKEPGARPASVTDWLDEFEKAAAHASTEEEDEGEARVVILAPSGAEVYIDDERHGSVGSSGRIILNSVPPGRHVLRVARTGERDDERVIEIRPEASEQIIEAHLRPPPTSNQLTPSQGGSNYGASGGSARSATPGIVLCTSCGSRYAAGVKFCGRCGNNVFQPLDAQPPSGQQSLGSGGGSYGTGGSAAGAGGGGGSFPSSHANRILCSRCGADYPPQTKFCGRCGFHFTIASPPLNSWRAPEMICFTCGKKYPVGTKFCGGCGSTIKP